eukprot:6467832-Amphidinium_carterae.3
MVLQCIIAQHYKPRSGCSALEDGAAQKILVLWQVLVYELNGVLSMSPKITCKYKGVKDCTARECGGMYARWEPVEGQKK